MKNCSDYPGYKEIANRCLKVEGNGTNAEGAELSSFLQEVTEDLSRTWPSILITCVVALVFSYVLLMLFRYAIKYVIWIIYIGLVVLMAVGSVVMLVFYFGVKNSNNPTERENAIGFLIASGVLALVAIVLGLVLYFFRKRIRLVVQLFKEASRALIDVPMIIVEPLLTFLALGLTCAGFLYFAMQIESSGSLTVKNDVNGKFDKATYEKNFAMSIAHYVNVIAFMWFTSFILGCQHFVIASTVCQWFFTRTKDKLDSPIQRAFSYLLRFHIGSVCLGSILITIMKIVRMIVNSIKVSSK